jgi:hypothetical protein
MKQISQVLLLTVSLIACAGFVAAAEMSRPSVSGPIGGGAPFAAPTEDVSAAGYVVEEFFLTGQASAYEMVDGQDQSTNGVWDTERKAASQPYKTRILVVRPGSNQNFNGTVIVHWQNVTAGYELGTVAPDSEYLRGYAWVGVSAQKIGIDGFPGPDAAGLKQWSADRYGSLSHPGDAYSFDIFSQAGRTVGPGRTVDEQPDPMGGLDVERLVAAGASQSAHRLRTYINGVHLHARVFDGFIPYIDFAGTISLAADKSGERRAQRAPTMVRTDLDVPVFVVNSETETQAYLSARQPDTDRFRFWEVAGTSHVSVPRETAATAPGLDSPNWLAFTPVYDAAVRHMHVWLTTGTPPPAAPVITTDGEPASITRDRHGNAIGGIRLPEIVVPTASHDGFGQPVEGGSRFAFLYGRALDFNDGELLALYPRRSDYVGKYAAALDAAIAAGYVLAEDRARLIQAATSWAVALPEG